jgi:ABC-type Fe3+-siderophore transport system permease subunit
VESEGQVLPENQAKPKRLILTIVGLHNSAGLAVVGTIAVAVLMACCTSRSVGAASAGGEVGIDVRPDFGSFGLMAAGVVVFAIAFAVAAELVVLGLNRRRYWAWVTGLVLAGIQVLSGWHYVVQVLLGGLVLWGLLDRESVDAFQKARRS